MNITIDGNYTLVESDSILDNPRLSMFQLVYGCSLIGVVVFAVAQSVIFTRVS